MAIIGSDIIRLKETESTNSYMMDQLSKGMPTEGTVVIADYQSTGRGTDGSKWESEPGLNLTFSFILYPRFLTPEAQFYLNKTISLGLSDLVHELLPMRDDIRIKWPNDIYIGNEKVAGTLIQNGVKGSSFDFSIIGIGLNVNQNSFPSDATNPVSLMVITNSAFDLEAIFNQLLIKLEYRLNQLIKGELKEIDREYLERLYRINQLAGYAYEGKSIKAKITGVNRFGQLILEIPGEKIIECDLKEIRFEI
jgi:BirA family transcriptional regulator, biotin operon repressor / biotin---[acetyl-CoA-carboxylase] ligase